jgi:hypothetical protein
MHVDDPNQTLAKALECEAIRELILKILRKKRSRFAAIYLDTVFV